MILELRRPIVSLDVETTGLNPKYDRVIQIGIIKIHPDGREKEWSTLVNPGTPIPSEACQIHGITDEMIASELPFAGIGVGLNNALKGCDLCGYNIKFDVDFLIAEFKRISIDFQPGMLIDSYKIFAKKEPKNLAAAVKFYLNEEISDGHQALPDARAALRILEAQLEKYLDLPRNINGLDQFCFGKSNEKFIWKGDRFMINFGKHKGVLLQDVPRDYLEWMMTGRFTDEVKHIVKEALQGRFPKK